MRKVYANTVMPLNSLAQLRHENNQGWRGSRAARVCCLRFVRNVVQMNGVEVRFPEICMKRRTNTGIKGRLPNICMTNRTNAGD